MSDPGLRGAYVGEAAIGAGYAIAGLATHAPAAGRELEALEAALGANDFVILEASCAARIPAERIEEALARTQPLLAVIDTLAGAATPFDADDKARRQLGIGA